MKLSCRVCLNLRIEGSRSPIICEERNGNYLAKSIHLEAAASHGTHNRRVVDYVDLHSGLDASQIQVSMSRCTEGIADDEEGNYLCLCFLNHLSTATLHELSISNNDIFTKELLEALI